MDGFRKRSLIRFLQGAELINRNNPIVDLSGADLRYAHLEHAHLERAYLNHVDLSGAYLSSAHLTHAHLTHADLSKADLRDADMLGANLTLTDLSDAKGCTEVQLHEAQSLMGVTMPNGQKYEDWLKTPEGQDWLRKYKKDLGAYKKKAGEYEYWIQTAEGRMWLRAVGENSDNGGPS